MKESNVPLCPGCRRHCPANAVRCGYGRKYFQKQAREAAVTCAECPKKHKWEKHVSTGGLLWTLITTSKQIKKTLCHQKASESQLLERLSPEEQQTLFLLLQKLRQPKES